MSKILREVKCDERLIKSEGCHLVIRNNTKYYLFLDEQFAWREEDGTTIPDFKYDSWFEEVELDLKSGEILPNNTRLNKEDKISLYRDIDAPLEFQLYFTNIHKALEAAELEIAVLKSDYDELLRRYENERAINAGLIKSKSAVRSNKKHLERIVLKGLAEDNERLSNSLNFEKMAFAKLKEAIEKDKDDNYKRACSNISWECIPSSIDKEQLKLNLKIASGINYK